MTLRASELWSVAEELQRELSGRPVQKVTQPDAHTIVLWFPRAWLLLSADARLGRMHLLSGKPAGTGEAAPSFCMLLRKELTGARLSSVTAVRGERAAELTFLRAGDTRRVRLFLYGKSAQLVIADHEGGTLGAVGPARHPHTALPASRDEQAPGRFDQGAPLSPQIEAQYAEEGASGGLAEARTAALAATRAALKKQKRLEEALEGDRARALASIDKRKHGDLILAHLAEIPRGASSVTLPDDFEAGAPLTIALDPARNARDNAERFYKEHRRLSRALSAIERRLAELRQSSSEAEARIAALERAEGDELAALVSQRTVERGRTRPQRGKRAEQTPAPPYREFRTRAGGVILVGRGSDRNDELTFKVARGSDLWLHTRDVPGAHVVVPLAPGRPVDEQTLLDAATLAAYHSSARDEPQVDVSYTLRKHVRKPPRSRPGSVLTSATKTLRVRIEPDRLKRLLASRVD